RYFTVQRHPVLTERQPKNADTLAAEPHNVVESHLCRQEQPKEIQSHRPPDSPATWETNRPMQASVGDPHDHTSLLRRRAHQLRHLAPVVGSDDVVAVSLVPQSPLALILERADLEHDLWLQAR